MNDIHSIPLNMLEHMTISHASAADLPLIQRLANEIWWPAYGHIIPHGQISLMLGELYSEEALARQVASGGNFLIVRLGPDPLGFAEYREKPSDPHVMRMEKLYVGPRAQGRGVGRRLIAFIADRARELGKTMLELNVNRGNEAAIGFYHKNGFEVVAETDAPYHEYVLNDYVMQKAL